MSVNTDVTRWSILFDENYEREINDLKKRCPGLYSKLIEYLTWNPDVTVGSHKVFPLKGNVYHGAWEYRVCVNKRTFRIFYTLDTTRHTVYIYYAGAKPNST